MKELFATIKLPEPYQPLTIACFLIGSDYYFDHLLRVGSTSRICVQLSNLSDWLSPIFKLLKTKSVTVK